MGFSPEMPPAEAQPQEGSVDESAQGYEQDVEQSEKNTQQELDTVISEADKLLPAKFPSILSWNTDNFAKMKADLGGSIFYAVNIPKIEDLFNRKMALTAKLRYLKQKEHMSPSFMGPHRDEPELPQEGI